MSLRFAFALGLLCVPAALSAQQSPTAAEAERFMAHAEAELADLGVKAARADWVNATYINIDTDALSAEAEKNYAVAVQRLATAAQRFQGLALPPALARKFMLLRLALAAPPPADSAKASELTRITVSLQSDYGKGKYCPHAPTGPCLTLDDLSTVLAESHDPDSLREAWVGWHAVGAPMRDRYARFAALSNEGARTLGFHDTGEMWRSGYDMPPDSLAQEVERLWQQLRPLYLQLHAYVRARLVERYGAAVVPPAGMIPADLLGNMWAQEWGNIAGLVAPKRSPPGYDLTALLRAHGVDPLGMVRDGEGFFTSLGFAPLPKTFWDRSLFLRPQDREVVCHASAWDIDNQDDVRIKVCLQVTGEDFQTVHHELGHNFYQRAYRDQPYLFKNGANDGFHEAIGDAIALSITPAYLKQIGLLDSVPGPAADTAALLATALDKVAFLPFALVVDEWRWGVFAGAIPESRYNAAWWELRNRLQGVQAPVARSEQDFDPGAKYHIPANTPYLRYFLARVLQFQFYRALCREAGSTGPLYRCSFYGSEAAGAKLARMLEAGQSRPWQDILYEMTGERDFDAGAMVEYFQPLMAWLKVQNRGKPVGW